MSRNIYMDRKKFIDYMELIKKEADMYNQITSILQNNNRDVVDLYPCTYTLSIKLISEIMNDEDQLIDQYVYEQYWGQDNEEVVTLDDLYEKLTKNSK